ncbi:MAG: class I SAM-dependent methyltransferase [Candidimonas sp.]
MTPSNRRILFHRLAAASAFVLALGAAHAQNSRDAAGDARSEAAAYEPQVGQAGKDVIWVPTSEALVDHMLRMAKITPEDYLVDLGSGDGRTVITAAQRGTRAHGIEFNPDMVELSREAARKAGVADKATFAEGDIFESDFSDATVVTMFLLPELNLRLRPILLDMKPGTRLVSNSFDMGDWEADESTDGGPECKSYCLAYKWIVPAKVAGTWTLDDGSTLTLDQTFQKLAGHLAANGERHALSEAVMQGKRIVFTANGRQYMGQVEADRMVGEGADGKAWGAKRG